ncbi:hypothetical protein C8A05DRAFT_18008 [Staphylotrichum tortipilum]|uniref:5-formyltetrahydrofolate cyclo-ligase n=1 Tax=Staphylotrichum tortipilum TaxID=2831512 RepID=A0AAN6MEX1_9PEZI|nr:hypothetical protein C8A05DRAFT_18008 [Staphylotrichum longicolle]
MATLNAAKQHLRAAMRHKLRAVSHDSIVSQSATVFHTLQSLPAYASARRVSVFLSMPTGEVQTAAVVRHALAAGKEVFIPYLHKNPVKTAGLPARVMDMVRLRDVADYEALQPDKWGIPSVDPGTVPQRERVLGDGEGGEGGGKGLDLILIPGVAFDAHPDNSGAIRRLGHGKGFYDYFLFRHAQKARSLGQHEDPVLLVGLALSEQFLSDGGDEGAVPVGPLDQPLRGLVLGDGRVKGRLGDAAASKTD